MMETKNSRALPAEITNDTFKAELSGQGSNQAHR